MSVEDAAGGSHPGAVLAALADPARVRVLAAVVAAAPGRATVGGVTLADVVAASGLSALEVARAVDRLRQVGLVGGHEDALVADLGVVGAAGREVGRMRRSVTAEDLGATSEQAAVLRGHLDERGRLTHLPTARAKRLLVLDFLANRFDPGRVYPEQQVSFELQKVHRDYAALRRALVDEGFLERRDGFYWRAGGSVDTETD